MKCPACGSLLAPVRPKSNDEEVPDLSDEEVMDEDFLGDLLEEGLLKRLHCVSGECYLRGVLLLYCDSFGGPDSVSFSIGCVSQSIELPAKPCCLRCGERLTQNLEYGPENWDCDNDSCVLGGTGFTINQDPEGWSVAWVK
jgi:hypothetical protein